jgi:hypothetical protein
VGRLARKYPYRRSYPQKTRIRYGSWSYPHQHSTQMAYRYWDWRFPDCPRITLFLHFCLFNIKQLKLVHMIINQSSCFQISHQKTDHARKAYPMSQLECSNAVSCTHNQCVLV